MMQRVYRDQLSSSDDITLKYKDEDGDLVPYSFNNQRPKIHLMFTRVIEFFRLHSSTLLILLMQLPTQGV
jgi:hypothetical protein